MPTGEIEKEEIQEQTRILPDGDKNGSEQEETWWLGERFLIAEWCQF